MIKNLGSLVRNALKLNTTQNLSNWGGSGRIFNHCRFGTLQNMQPKLNRLSPVAYKVTAAKHVCVYSTITGQKNYYTILGITPNATQAQIKEAYYKLSMKHHPDRHKGSDEATDIFQEITEAYSVLGDHDLRKKYDRGLVVDGKVAQPPHQHKTRPKPKPTNQNYDFDEWTRMHYKEAMKRTQRNMRDRYEEELEKSKHKLREGSQRIIVLGVVFMILFLVYLIERRHRKSELEALLKDSEG